MQYNPHLLPRAVDFMRRSLGRVPWEKVISHTFPLEDARAQEAYGIHSGVNKIVIINRETVPGRITVVLVDEAIGF